MYFFFLFFIFFFLLFVRGVDLHDQAGTLLIRVFEILRGWVRLVDADFDIVFAPAPDMMSESRNEPPISTSSASGHRDLLGGSASA